MGTRARGLAVASLCAAAIACGGSNDDDAAVDAAATAIDARVGADVGTLPCLETGCTDGLVCKSDACVPCVDVDDDALCTAGSICVDAACIPGDCRATADCTDQVCTDNTCSSCVDPVPATPRSRFPADGDAADVIGANSGVAAGGLAFADGVKCSAFDFDGVDDTVTVAVPQLVPTGNEARTIALWVKIDTFQQDDEILVWGSDSTGRKSAIALKKSPDQGGPTVFFWGFQNDVVSDTTLSEDTWYHVAFTFDGVTGTLYIDGAVVGTRPMTLDTATGTQLRMGSGLAGTGDAFAGDVDDVLIYGRALSATDIAGLAAAR